MAKERVRRSYLPKYDISIAQQGADIRGEQHSIAGNDAKNANFDKGDVNNSRQVIVMDEKRKEARTRNLCLGVKLPVNDDAVNRWQDNESANEQLHIIDRAGQTGSNSHITFDSENEYEGDIAQENPRSDSSDADENESDEDSSGAVEEISFSTSRQKAVDQLSIERKTKASRGAKVRRTKKKKKEPFDQGKVLHTTRREHSNQCEVFSPLGEAITSEGGASLAIAKHDMKDPPEQFPEEMLALLDETRRKDLSIKKGGADQIRNEHTARHVVFVSDSARQVKHSSFLPKENLELVVLQKETYNSFNGDRSLEGVMGARLGSEPSTKAISLLALRGGESSGKAIHQTWSRSRKMKFGYRGYGKAAMKFSLR